MVLSDITIKRPTIEQLEKDLRVAIRVKAAECRRGMITTVDDFAVVVSDMRLGYPQLKTERIKEIVLDMDRIMSEETRQKIRGAKQSITASGGDQPSSDLQETDAQRKTIRLGQKQCQVARLVWPRLDREEFRKLDLAELAKENPDLASDPDKTRKLIANQVSLICKAGLIIKKNSLYKRGPNSLVVVYPGRLPVKGTVYDLDRLNDEGAVVEPPPLLQLAPKKEPAPTRRKSKGNALDKAIAQLEAGLVPQDRLNGEIQLKRNRLTALNLELAEAMGRNDREALIKLYQESALLCQELLKLTSGLAAFEQIEKKLEILRQAAAILEELGV